MVQRHLWEYYVITRVTYTQADEDEYLDKASKHMGEIRLDVWRVMVRSRHPMNLFRGVYESEGKVHERSKKALSHCVG